MNLDEIGLMVALAVLLGLLGYYQLAVIVVVLFLALALFKGAKEKRVGAVPGAGISVQGAEVLEPIIIETRRSPPFRIPSKMDIQVNPHWYSKPWREKIAGSGFGMLGALLFTTLLGRRREY